MSHAPAHATDDLLCNTLPPASAVNDIQDAFTGWSDVEHGGNGWGVTQHQGVVSDTSYGQQHTWRANARQHVAIHTMHHLCVDI